MTQPTHNRTGQRNRVARRALTAATALVAAAGFSVLAAGPASALGGETFGCRISPGPAGSYSSNCHNSAKYHAPYSAGFLVQGAAAGTTYAWTVPAGRQIAPGTCGTTAGCRIDNLSGDDFIPVSVTLTQGSAAETLTAYATIIPVCGNVYC